MCVFFGKSLFHSEDEEEQFYTHFMMIREDLFICVTYVLFVI